MPNRARRVFDRILGRPRPDDDTSIGHLLIKIGFITRDQLRDAIRVKVESSGAQLLGEVLISTGALTRSQLDRALMIQKEVRGEHIDYVIEAERLLAKASAAAENIHSVLGEIEQRARAIADRPMRPLKLTRREDHDKKH